MLALSQACTTVLPVHIVCIHMPQRSSKPFRKTGLSLFNIAARSNAVGDPGVGLLGCLAKRVRRIFPLHHYIMICLSMTQYDHALRLLRITRVEVVPVPRSRSPVGLRLSRRRRQEEGFRGAPGIAGIAGMGRKGRFNRKSAKS